MLYNMESNNGYLEANDYNAYAISETFDVPNQYAGEMDSIVIKWQYYNISQSTDPNILKTTEPIKNGDKMVVIINNVPTNILAFNVVDDTAGSGFYTMFITEMNGLVPTDVFLIEKYANINFGNGFNLLIPDTELYSFNATLESVVKYKPIQYNTNILTTRIDIYGIHNKMIEFRSKFCTIIAECFVSADNYKIQTTDDYYFCAI